MINQATILNQIAAQIDADQLRLTDDAKKALARVVGAVTRQAQREGLSGPGASLRGLSEGPLSS
jgi:hypothetical protein